MVTEKNFFINNPIFVKYKKRFDFKVFRSRDVLKSVNINERIVEIPFAIQAITNLSRGAKILDLGCTESPLPLQLSSLGYAVTGFDFREYPYHHPNLTVVQGDMTKLPFEKGTFDAIMSISTLEYVGIGFYADPQEVQQADKKAVGEIVRVLKPGGIFVLTAPYGVCAQTGQQRIYDEKSLAEVMGAQLNVEDIRYLKSVKSDEANCNTWVEITKQEAAGIASPEATSCVCLVKAKKR